MYAYAHGVLRSACMHAFPACAYVQTTVLQRVSIRSCMYPCASISQLDPTIRARARVGETPTLIREPAVAPSARLLSGRERTWQRSIIAHAMHATSRESCVFVTRLLLDSESGLGSRPVVVKYGVVIKSSAISLSLLI